MPLICFALAALVTTGCTYASDGPDSVPPREVGQRVGSETHIYAAVIRRLVTRDHTFGRGPSPFLYVYVVNGAIETAGHAVGDHFGPASQTFPPRLREGLQRRLQDLPPLRFIRHGNDVRRGQQGMGGVKNDGVIISLGRIERNRGRVEVATGLWCGGTCGQWLTYVLERDVVGWRITGTTGPYAIS